MSLSSLVKTSIQFVSPPYQRMLLTAACKNFQLKFFAYKQYWFFMDKVKQKNKNGKNPFMHTNQTLQSNSSICNSNLELDKQQCKHRKKIAKKKERKKWKSIKTRTNERTTVIHCHYWNCACTTSIELYFCHHPDVRL